MKKQVRVFLLLCIAGMNASVHAANANDSNNLFQKLDDRTQDIKLHILDLNRSVNKYAATSKKAISGQFRGGNRASFSLDFVNDDYKKHHYLDAINRYHAGRDFGVILSKYETALKVANIYLDYGLYHYSKRIFKSLLGDQDSAVASLARYYLAKHNFLNHYWDEALKGFESVTDGIPLDLLDKKRIMQAIILADHKRQDDVINVLSEIPKTSKYYNYARFNIAMAYLRKGWWSDTDDNIKLVLNSLNSDDAVTRAFRDRLYIALGYYQLQREFYREAYNALSKVDKNGPYGYKAQLGIGIVAAEQGKYKESLKILNSLKDTYSNQLVTEEAYIVMPFVLESIGSTGDTIKYYADASHYYEQSMQDITHVQAELKKGEYDKNFVPLVAANGKREADTSNATRTSQSKVTRYISKLDVDRQWSQAMQNVKDLAELQRHLQKINDELEKSGSYKVNTYKKLQSSIRSYQAEIARLEQDYRQFTRIYLTQMLEGRKKYFVSYLNQSQYALARINDTALGDKTETQLAGKTVNEQTVRDLYRNYLKSAVKASRNRRAALMRLAELDFNAYEHEVAKSNDAKINKVAKVALNSAVHLLESALKDYPKEKDNDKILYQLAVAYDKQMQTAKVNQTMRQLVDNFPQSKYYTEIQFKLGENYLTSNESIDAELAYTAAVSNGEKNSVFYQRALYKRGWSRLRQSIYEDALSDFFEVLEMSHYDEHAKRTPAEQEFINDVLRAVSLCFSDMGGIEPINKYFAKFRHPKYSYLAYQKVGELYESEGRASDAVDLYDSYIKRNVKSPHAAQFMVKIVNAWQTARIPNKELEARTLFESKFNLNSAYWKKNDINQQSNVRQALEDNVRFMAKHFHGSYQKSHSSDDLRHAKYWYDEFAQYAPQSKDPAKMYFMYAELLSEAGEGDKAVAFYEKANKGDSNRPNAAKEAAYAAVVTSDNILKKSTTSAEKDRWLFKKVDYSLRYIKEFPKDKRSPEVLLNALQGLYGDKLYKRTLAVIKQSPTFSDETVKNKVDMYQANSLFELNQYADAEKIYQRLFRLGSNSEVDRKLVMDRLAGSIYRQGEMADKQGNTDLALASYKRVLATVPDTKFAANANYDAATVLLKMQKYKEAGKMLEMFLKQYPGHRLQTEANNKLAIIYMKESDPSKSAVAFMAVANDPSIDKKRRRESLWQAADLYNDSGNVDAALDAYLKYLDLYSDNYEQTMEAKYKLAELYGKKNQTSKQLAIYRAMVDTESKIRFNLKTDRTQYLAAHAAVNLMEQDIKAYNAIAIREPLKETLGKKKRVLKKLVDGLTHVSNYAIEDTTTWALFNIGEAYREFSRALLNSPRPRNLKGMELEQYEVLLEEQAYPFEEKALGFYKENLDNVKSGIYNQWIKNSLQKLAVMVPARYNKKEKQEAYFDRPLDEPKIATASK